MSTRRLSVAILLALVSPSLPAKAQEVAPPPVDQPREDEELIRQGVELRRAGRNEEALALFQRAHALRPSARSTAQMALAEQALGRWLSAERGLELALAQPSDPWIDKNRAALDEALATVRKHVGSLVVECNVAGAALVVGGAPAGSLPMVAPMRVVSGATTVEVRAPGYEPARRTIDVAAGTTAREAFQLVPIAAPAIPQSPTADRAAPSTPFPVQKTVGWATLGLGGVALALGVYAHTERESSAALYNDDDLCFKGPLTRDQRCGDHREAADTAQTWMIALYGTGAALAIGGLALVLTAPRATRAPAPATACRVGVGALTCGSAF